MSDHVRIIAEVSGPDMGVPHAPNLSRDYIIPAVSRTLDRLGTESIDCLILPRPSFTVPLEDTLEGISSLLEDGFIRSWGTSTFPAWMIVRLHSLAERLGLASPVLEELPYNLADRRAEREALPACDHLGLVVLAWAPLAQGVLAGTYSFDQPPSPDSRALTGGPVYRDRVTLEAVQLGADVKALASSIGRTPAQLACAWIRSRGTRIFPVVGCRTVAQLEEIATYSGDRLGVDELSFIDEHLCQPGSHVANFYNTAPWMLAERLGTSFLVHPEERSVD